MLRIIKFKILMFSFGLTAMGISALIICIGGLEIYLDWRKKPKITTRIIEKSILCFVNAIMFGHVMLLFVLALNGYRRSWVVGFNYCVSVICQLISFIIMVSKYDHFHNKLALAILLGVQAVIIFFMIRWAEEIFSEIEELISKRLDDVLYKAVLKVQSQKKNCKRLRLDRGAKLNVESKTDLEVEQPGPSTLRK